MSRTIMVVGKGSEVARLSYDSKKNSFKTTNFEATVDSNVKGNVRINCLAVVVLTMEQLKEAKLAEGSEVATIYTVGLVSDMVSRGTFKFWVQSEGKKLSGEEVTDVELALWNKFTELYLSMFMNLNIRNISECSLPAKPKYKVSAEQKNLAVLAEKIWDKVGPSEPEEELEEEAL